MALTFDTDRLCVRPLDAGDAESLFHLRSHPAVRRFQGWCPEDVADARAFIERQDPGDLGRQGSWFQLAIRDRSSARLLGDIGLHFVEEQFRQVEFGVTIDPARHRGGLATEAVTGLLDHLFGGRSTHRVLASVDPANTASIALLRRVGFRQEGHFVESLLVDGEWVDDLRFALLRREWRS